MHGTLLYTTSDERIYLLSAGAAHDELYGYCVNDPLPAEMWKRADWLDPALEAEKIRPSTPCFKSDGHDQTYRFICPDIGERLDGEEIVAEHFFKVVSLELYLASPKRFVLSGIVVKGRRLFSIYEINQRRRSGEWQLRVPFPPHVVFGSVASTKSEVFKQLPDADDFDFTTLQASRFGPARIVIVLKKLSRMIGILRFHPVVNIRLAVRAHFRDSDISKELEESVAVTVMRLGGERFKEVTDLGRKLIDADPENQRLSLQRIGRWSIARLLTRVMKSLAGLTQIDQHYIELRRQCDLVGANIIAMCWIIKELGTHDPATVAPQNIFFHDAERTIHSVAAVVKDGQRNEAKRLNS